ncbi:hypothetical protein QDY71_02910 [Kingella negevensis]|nr:hypothetical protein [Kingella negevensis]MDK4679567.1 hypothetical protein [Kingella negevensis]MDK4682715.1 hypothetical protein [Kingella negevensis]MDK4685242.1 hypothetical protein [Kingella negevensis]MDK4690912.1 hypothetical protein [Kingella negevensis]MDK4693941.1 hypothetical protein [Kingella negevensis]
MMKQNSQQEKIRKLKTEALVLSLKAFQAAKEKNLVQTITVQPIPNKSN